MSVARFNLGMPKLEIWKFKIYCLFSAKQFELLDSDKKEKRKKCEGEKNKSIKDYFKPFPNAQTTRKPKLLMMTSRPAALSRLKRYAERQQLGLLLPQEPPRSTARPIVRERLLFSLNQALSSVGTPS